MSTDRPVSPTATAPSAPYVMNPKLKYGLYPARAVRVNRGGTSLLGARDVVRWDVVGRRVSERRGASRSGLTSRAGFVAREGSGSSRSRSANSSSSSSASKNSSSSRSRSLITGSSRSSSSTMMAAEPKLIVSKSTALDSASARYASRPPPLHVDAPLPRR